MTDEQPDKGGSLSFNRTTGYYEGTVRIQVDSELFRRKLFREMEENESANLSDPQVLLAIIAQVSKTSAWLSHPHTRILSHEPVLPKPAPPSLILPVERKRESRAGKGSLQTALREKARHVAPHLWDEQCITPYGDTPFGGKERGRLGTRRHEERSMLHKLRAEWEAGTFILDAGAAEEEEHYQKEQRGKLAQKLEVIAVAVNSNGFH